MVKNTDKAPQKDSSGEWTDKRISILEAMFEMPIMQIIDIVAEAKESGLCDNPVCAGVRQAR